MTGDFQNFAWLAAAGGIFATCWRQILSVFNRLRSFAVVQVDMQGDVGRAVESYLNKHARRSPFGDKTIQSENLHVRPLRRVQEVAWEVPSVQPVIYFMGWAPIFFGACSDVSHMGTSTGIPASWRKKLTYLRGFLDLDDLIIKALAEFNEQKGSGGMTRYFVKRVCGMGRKMFMGKDGGTQNDVRWNPCAEDKKPDFGSYIFAWAFADLGADRPLNPMGGLSMPRKIAPLAEEFTRWKNSEEWFKSKMIPWRRGWLLHGRPGTGKTSLIRALAQKADMPIFSYDLASLSNDELIQKWSEMQSNAPCVALFEDIDAVFHGRENILGEQGGGLTFDCLLNCLGGIETCDGIFTVVTTNCIDKIDAALGIMENGVSTRPGRLDQVVAMPELEANNLREIATRILGDWPELITPMVQRGEGCTGAQFTELCVQTALEKYWNHEQPAKIHPVGGNGSVPHHIIPVACP